MNEVKRARQTLTEVLRGTLAATRVTSLSFAGAALDSTYMAKLEPRRVWIDGPALISRDDNLAHEQS